MSQRECDEFIEEAEGLIKDFQERFRQLVQQHCSRGGCKLGGLCCPECKRHFSRRNNLERHWPKHTKLDGQRCLFCHEDTPFLYDALEHHKLCEQKVSFPSNAHETKETTRRHAKWENEALSRLDSLLGPVLGRRKRRMRRREIGQTGSDSPQQPGPHGQHFATMDVGHSALRDTEDFRVDASMGLSTTETGCIDQTGMIPPPVNFTGNPPMNSSVGLGTQRFPIFSGVRTIDGSHLWLSTLD